MLFLTRTVLFSSLLYSSSRFSAPSFGLRFSAAWVHFSISLWWISTYIAIWRIKTVAFLLSRNAFRQRLCSQGVRFSWWAALWPGLSSISASRGRAVSFHAILLAVSFDRSLTYLSLIFVTKNGSSCLARRHQIRCYRLPLAIQPLRPDKSIHGYAPTESVMNSMIVSI